MKPVFFSLVIAMWPLHITVTNGFIDCRTACIKCRDGTEDLDLLEVYCSMCKECRDKRRELLGRHTTPPVDISPEVLHPVRRFRPRTFYHPPPALRMDVEDEARLATWPEHCPTPPLCAEEPVTDPRTFTENEQTTPHTVTTPPTPPPTTTRTTTIALETCPPIDDKCRTRYPNQPTGPGPNNRYTTKCVPCNTECPCPFPSEININVNWNKGLRTGSTVPITVKSSSNTSDKVVIDTEFFKKLLMSYAHHSKGNKQNALGDGDINPDTEIIARRTNDKGDRIYGSGPNKKNKKRTKSAVPITVKSSNPATSKQVVVDEKFLSKLLTDYDPHSKEIKLNDGVNDSGPEAEIIETTITEKSTTSDASEKVTIDAKLLRKLLKGYYHHKKLEKQNAVDSYMDLYGKMIKHDRDGHFTTKTNIHHGIPSNFQNTIPDKDYFYIYLGVPQDLAESKGATISTNDVIKQLAMS